MPNFIDRGEWASRHLAIIIRLGRFRESKAGGRERYHFVKIGPIQRDVWKLKRLAPSSRYHSDGILQDVGRCGLFKGGAKFSVIGLF